MSPFNLAHYFVKKVPKCPCAVDSRITIRGCYMAVKLGRNTLSPLKTSALFSDFASPSARFLPSR